MIMKKKLIFAAIAITALASCTSNDFVGEESPQTANGTEGAISFGSNSKAVTRATSNTGTVAEMLDGQFLIYGTKNVKNASSEDVYSIVFPNYVAWNNSGLTATTSNPDGNNASNGWEYVGTTSTTYGANSTALTKDQTIKYWDYAAANYHFVAGSPVNNFTYTITSNDITSAAVTGLGGHISANPTSGSGTALSLYPVYIAKPVTVEPGNYNKPVTFEFVRQEARVRVGIYETIPGYKITNIKFYPYDASDWGSTSSNNIILASTAADYFVGATSASATVTYNWTGSETGVTYPNYTFAYDASGLTKAKNWYAGELNALGWVMATTSTESTVGTFYGTDKDMAATGYFTVIPTPTATTASPLLIKCDYVLEPVNNTTEGSNETITVKGATAAVPAAFSKWAPNTSYTYLFKISDNTNGYTGTTSQPSGLYPITFDAVAVAEATSAEEGYTTTVSTPSITTYQAGSVTTEGIKYVTGKAIYFTVQDNTDGTLKTLNNTASTVGCVKVYWLGTTAQTEADLQLTAPTSELAAANPANSTALSLPNSPWSHNGQSVAANNYGTFTPGTAGYYAIQYLTTAAGAETPAAYTYKIVKVEAPEP